MLCTRTSNKNRLRQITQKYTNKSVDSPSCRMCGETGKTISHIVSECSKLAQREQKRSYDKLL